jgi:hypothetical protein
VLLAFAEPPKASKEQVAEDCTGAGLTAIGIIGPYPATLPVDFGAISRDACIAFGQTTELCIDSKGFQIDGLAGSFVQLHQRRIVMLFGNLVSAITNLMES